MCSCPLISRFRLTYEGTGSYGTYLTPVGMLMEIAYTSSESKMLCPPSLKFAEFRYRDFFAMLFLLIAFALESKCKITKCFSNCKKYFAVSEKRCTFAAFFLNDFYREI